MTPNDILLILIIGSLALIIGLFVHWAWKE